MHGVIQFLIYLGGVGAAIGVGVMCAVCLLVWIGGSPRKEPGEAWRKADKV